MRKVQNSYGYMRGLSGLVVVQSFRHSAWKSTMDRTLPTRLYTGTFFPERYPCVLRTEVLGLSHQYSVPRANIRNAFTDPHVRQMNFGW